MASIASLVVKIGGNADELTRALSSVGERAKGLDTDLKKLGNTPVGAAAQKSLESMRVTMDQITKAQQGVADRAAAAAEGIAQMGGASKLTDSQLKQVNRTLQEGLSAFQALGKEAPEHLKNIASAVETNLSKPMGAVQGKIIALGTALGTFLGNAAVEVGRQLIDAAKATFDWVDALENLSASTGISAQGLQRLEAIGVTSGVSMDTLAGSVEQLQKHLNDPAAIKAIEAMGKNYAAIRNLKPEEQFFEIAKGVAAIEDPVERANAGAALFGRTWTTIAGTIKGDIEKVIRETRTLSDEQLEAINKQGDAWDRWKHDTTMNIRAVLGEWVLLTQKFNEEGIGTVNGPAKQLAARQAREFGDGKAPSVAGLAPRLFNRMPLANLAAPEDLREVKIFGMTMDEQREKIDAARTAAEHLKSVQDQLFGRATIEHAEELVKALGTEDNLTKLTDASTKKLHDDLGQALIVYRALGKEVPPALQAIYDKTYRLRQVGTGMVAFGPGAIPTSTGLDPLSFSTNLEQRGLSGPTSITRAAKDNIAAATVARSFSDDLAVSVPNSILAAIQGGGSKLQAAGSTLGMTLFGRDSHLTKSISGLFSAEGFLGKTLSSAVPIIGSLLGPALQGLGKLWGKVFGTEGRDAVREFAASKGGFDTLHAKLGTLGADGEALWKNLTQGVGRNNPEEAAAAIKKVTEAFEAQRQKVLALQGQLGTIGTRLSGITTLTPDLQAKLEAAFTAKNPEDYARALAGITTELDEQQAKFDLIKNTLAKYGISFTQAGKEFKQAALNETASGLITDFNVLQKAGVDIKVEIHGMSDQLSKFAQDAKKAGVEVPEEMRKILQAAIDNGELFDENGVKITDMKDLGLTFGTTMETVMKKTIPDAIAKLTTVLEGLAKFLGITLPDAAKDGADKTQSELDSITPPDLTVHVKTQLDPFNSPDFPDGFQGGPDGASTGAVVRPWGLQHLARGGFAGTDTVAAMLTPGELVLNAAQQKNVADALGNGGGLLAELRALREDVRGLYGALRLNLDGREVARAVNRVWDNGGAVLTESRQALGVG